MHTVAIRTAVALSLASAAPLAAQDPGTATAASEGASRPAGAPPSVFDGDWITIGIGGGVGSSYDGSDDYVFSPIPFLQGKLGGVAISPRPAGLALDFVDDPRGSAVELTLGVAARLNRNRASNIEDPIVAAYGELETAIEVGPTAELTFNGILHNYDSITVGVDTLWDVNGAHRGLLINPSVTYFTPLSRGVAVIFALSATHVDDDYADYYYSVPNAPAAVPAADRLPTFAAEGGIDKIGANLLFGADFDGDSTNGGLSGFLISGYSRMQGDGARTPFTSVRGAADQWFLAAGVGYTF